MYIDKKVIYADDYKVLYKKSTNRLIGKSAYLTVTNWSPTGEKLSAPQWEDESYFYELPDVSELRYNKLVELHDHDDSDAVNTITVNGVAICFRSQRRLQLRTLAEICLANGKELMNVWSDDVEYTVPVVLVLNVLDQYELYASEVYDATAAHKAFLDGCDNAEEIIAYDVTAGYPEPLNINIEL